MKKLLVFILPLTLLLFSCHKNTSQMFMPDNDSKIEEPQTDQNKPTLSISKSEIEIHKSAEAFEYTLNISAPADSSWEISGTPDWLTIDPTHGNGNTEITIQGNENESDALRIAEIQVKTSLNTVKVKIIQKTKDTDNGQENQEKPTLSISKSEIELNKPSDAFEAHLNIAIPEDSSWKVINTPSWMTVTPDHGTGSAKISIQAEKNNKPEIRIGTFKIAASFDTILVKIYQEASIEDNISTDELLFDFDESATKSVKVTTGGDWEFVNLPDNHIPGWITVNPQDGSGSTSVEISVDENYGTESRSADIDLNINGLDTTITVNQKVNPALDLSKGITLIHEGKYLKLSNATDFFEIPNKTVFNFPKEQSFSISMKMKVTGMQDHVTPYILSSIGPAGSASIKIYTHRDLKKVNVLANDNNGNAIGTGAFGTTEIDDGEWHHLVFVIDKDKKESVLYIDGKQDHVKGFTDYSDFDFAAPILIGTSNIGGTIHLRANFDDLHFWKKALNKKEVYADAANVALPDIQDDLIAGWDFESESGNIVKDKVADIEGELKNGASIE